jgi:hypothetical protein
MLLYSPKGSCFFAFVNAVYHYLVKNPNAQNDPDCDTIGYSVGSLYLRNGWRSSTWQLKERAIMIPALVNLYNRYDGREWTRFRSAMARVTTHAWLKVVIPLVV